MVSSHARCYCFDQCQSGCSVGFVWFALVCALVVIIVLEDCEDGPNGVRVEGDGGVYSHKDSVSR